MEIKPPNSGHLEGRSPGLTQLSSVSLSPIEALQLTPGKQYSARVLGPYLASQTATDAISKPAAAPKAQATKTAQSTAAQTNPATTPAAVTPSETSPQSWILLIRDKAILVETLAKLISGQQLEVRPQKNVSGTGLSLAILKPSTQTSAPLNNATNVSAPSSTEAPQGKIPLAQIKENLIRAITQTLPRQVSIETGLKALQQIAQSTVGPPPDKSPAGQAQAPTSPPTMNISQAITNALNTTTVSDAPTAKTDPGQVQQLAKVILSQLESRLPKVDTLLERGESTRSDATNTTNTALNRTTSDSALTGANQTLKHTMENGLHRALLDSGAFFENRLQQSPAQVSWLRFELTVNTAIQELRQFVQNQTPVAPPVTSSESIAKPATNSPSIKPEFYTATLRNLETLSTTLQQPLPQIASQLKQVIQQIERLPEASTRSSLISLNTFMDQSNNLLKQITNGQLTEPPAQDLKGTLLQLLSALSAPDKAERKTSLDALAQPDLLRTPFQFPHPGTTDSLTALAKADALMADQEVSTGTLLKLLAGMLNRLQFNQLNSLYQSQGNPADTNQTQSWFIELPVTNPAASTTLFSVRIDRETRQKNRQSNDQQESTLEWKINLSFELEDLGKLTIQARLQPPNISTTIWSDRPDTLRLIQKEQEVFKDNLNQLGLQVNEIQCYPGQPRTDSTPIAQSLVDVRA